MLKDTLLTDDKQLASPRGESRQSTAHREYEEFKHQMSPDIENEAIDLNTIKIEGNRILVIQSP